METVEAISRGNLIFFSVDVTTVIFVQFWAFVNNIETELISTYGHCLVFTNSFLIFTNSAFGFYS